MLRTAMQLASCLLTHKDTLPIWACIFDHGDDPARDPDGLNRIHVRPHKHLNAASQKAVLERLDQAAKRVRFHFKIFEGGDYFDHAPEEPGLGGFLTTLRAEEEEASWENLPEGQMLYYAWKDGKPTVEIDDPVSTNIWVNVGNLNVRDTFDDSSTISQLRAAIIEVACTLVHEFFMLAAWVCGEVVHRNG